MSTHHCPRCRTSLPAPRSRVLPLIVVGLAYTVTLAFGFIYACLGPTGFAFLLLLLPGGIGMITSAHAWARNEQTCPACEAVFEPTQATSTTSAPVHTQPRSAAARVSPSQG